MQAGAYWFPECIRREAWELSYVLILELITDVEASLLKHVNPHVIAPNFHGVSSHGNSLVHH